MQHDTTNLILSKLVTGKLQEQLKIFDKGEGPKKKTYEILDICPNCR